MHKYMEQVLQLDSTSDLIRSSQEEFQLIIARRTRSAELEGLTRLLASKRFQIRGTIILKTAKEQIIDALEDTLSNDSVNQSDLTMLVDDLALNCCLFGEILGTQEVGLWFGSQRGCARYHIDNVPLRMLVTYLGQGTAWLPNEAANRDAYRLGAPNEQIVRDPSKVQYVEPWHIALFRGGDDGVIHRTPDSALGGNSLLLRLDVPSFWADSKRLSRRLSA